MRRRLLLVIALLGVGLVDASIASAAWTPGPEIVSVDNARREQADGATTFAQISADQRYVVFQARATNFFPDGDDDPDGVLRQGGVFRYDRRTGAIVVIADGDTVTQPGGTLRTRGAANPSISADGSIISFSTAQRLVPQDLNENIDVYVRDTAVADRTAVGAYELVSALSATQTPPSYEPRNPPVPGQTPGADVWPGTSISADGRFVAFRTVEQRSDLAGTGPLQTPPGTVFVRDRGAGTTTVVSRALSDGRPVGTSEAPVVLSADGSTVAWVSNSAPSQTRFLAGEQADTEAPFYLWRRWADLGATTRRITGVADLDDPACPAGSFVATDPSATGPCYGPLTDIERGGNDITLRAPALSADGFGVAFLTGATPRPTGDGNPGLDLYSTSMRPGVSRKAGTRQLTADTAGGAARANGDIDSVALSADGRRLAFTTVRSAFILGSPAFVGMPRADVVPTELFTIDLTTDVIERVVFSPAGGDANDATLVNPSLSADGSRIAFVSRASNLLAGDANDVADAFVATLRPPAAAGPRPAGLDKRPASLIAEATQEPELRLRVTRRKDGAVVLRVRSPLAGRLEASASTRTRPRPPRGRAPRSSKRPRRVARAARTLTRAGEASLVLKIAGADGRRIRAGFSVTAAVTVRLTPRQGERLEIDEQVTFRGTRARKQT